jgi:hypothetical protein
MKAGVDRVDKVPIAWLGPRGHGQTTIPTLGACSYQCLTAMRKLQQSFGLNGTAGMASRAKTNIAQGPLRLIGGRRRRGPSS